MSSPDLIDRPADAMDERNWLPASPELRRSRCKNESPSWGWEGEGEQCQRLAGHEGPHYFDDPDVTMQWVNKS